MKVAQLISQERTQECVVEQAMDVAVPLVVLPIKADIVDAVQLRTVKQGVDIPVLPHGA